MLIDLILRYAVDLIGILQKDTGGTDALVIAAPVVIRDAGIGIPAAVVDIIGHPVRPGEHCLVGCTGPDAGVVAATCVPLPVFIGHPVVYVGKELVGGGP